MEELDPLDVILEEYEPPTLRSIPTAALVSLSIPPPGETERRSSRAPARPSWHGSSPPSGPEGPAARGPYTWVQGELSYDARALLGDLLGDPYGASEAPGAVVDGPRVTQLVAELCGLLLATRGELDVLRGASEPPAAGDRQQSSLSPLRCICSGRIF